MTQDSLRSIAIVGGGTAGWIAAAVLARLLPKGRTRITLIESGEVGIVGVGEATVPLIGILHGLLGIDEQDFVRKTQATFKLGIEFRDWGEIGNIHFHGFGDFGDRIEGISPHHHWLKLRSLGDETPLGDYSLPAALASRRRFAPPDPRGGEHASYRYAYHFDAGLYARYLRHYAEARGVVRREAHVADVRLRKEDGFVEAVVTSDGEPLEADFFVDCTGFAGLLIERALASGYEDWSRWLPCDRAVALPSRSDGAPAPYTAATACQAGWQWRIPLQHRIGNGYVYAGAFLDDEAALRALLADLGEEPGAEPKVFRFTSGHRRRFWNRNVLALGLAAGFMEPLESTSIQLIQTGIARFVDMLPDRRCDPILADEYNRVTRAEYERIRDFLILHYCLTRRDDSDFWRHCAAMEIPEMLARKIALFRSRGIVAAYAEESHPEPSWVSILIGQGAIPERYDPLVDRIDPASLEAGMRHRRAGIARAAEAMPFHGEFIARTCAAAVDVHV